MNKTQSIQRSKLISSYGGVGSTIDTIDNLAYIIKPFDQWNIYTRRVTRYPNRYPELLFTDQRLISRLHNIGFDAIECFFQPDDNFKDLKLYDPATEAINRMVTAKYSPEWFYCEKCGRLKRIDEWSEVWGDGFGDAEPRCAHCRTGNQRFRAPRLQQVRFVLASLENSELKDIPWEKLRSAINGSCNFRGAVGEVRSVWDFRNVNDEQEVTFHINKGGSDLIDVYVKFPDGSRLTLADIMNHYFVLDDQHVYQPVIRSANNVYFPYSLSSLYIPRHIITQEEVDGVIKWHNRGLGIGLIQDIFRKLSLQDIQYIIDNEVAPDPDYSSEEKFRMDEYDLITNRNNYKGGIYQPDERLDVREYTWAEEGNIRKPGFIKDIYLLKHLEVTSVQIAYSRLERVSAPNYSTMTGDARKQWFDLNRGVIINPNNPGSPSITVGLHPTCGGNRAQIKYMPAVISRGEGFFVELNLDSIDDADKKEVFTHTYVHLVMKELEFSCGYPLPSMNERLYILPSFLTEAESDKYGFVIYSANGEAGSYGGISTLFDNHAIEKILINAIDLAEDCPNDPICESEKASCFACVQIPETACEKFNNDLSRIVFKEVSKLYSSSTSISANSVCRNSNSESSIHQELESTGNSQNVAESQEESHPTSSGGEPSNSNGITPGIILG